MTTEFTSKQPYEAYGISFDFTSVLGTEAIDTAVITAIDQLDSSDVSTIILDVTKQSNTDTIVYGWVRAGTSGHRYLITCKIVGDSDSQYELDGILPVTEIPDTGVISGGGLVVAPIIEPITLAELKLHLRIDSGSFADNIDETQSIPPGSHVIANNYTTHAGTAVEVLGYTAVVVANFGVLTIGGVVDIKIQESDDNTTWTDWITGAFTQVTIAAANSTQEKAYTGTKRYIRTVVKVITQNSEFGTTVIRLTATSIEDDDLNDAIKDGREHIENITRRAILTQTWDYSLPGWPTSDFIKLPYGNLQTVSSVKWKDSTGFETTLAITTDYLVETNGEQCGKIVLPYGVTWPSGTLYPSNPITIRFVCGWTTAILVPKNIKRAVKFAAEDSYYHGDRHSVLEKVINNLLSSYRLWDEF